MSYLHDQGYQTKLADTRELIYYHKTNDYLSFLYRIISDFSPDIVGINMLTAQFDEAKMIAGILRISLITFK